MRKNRRESSQEQKYIVELTKTGIMIRVFFVAIAVLVASFAFYSVFRKVLHTEPGWQTVPATRTETGVGERFVLNYEFGTSGDSAAQEWVKLTKKYPELLDRAEKIFDVSRNTQESQKGEGADSAEEEIAGIGLLNRHPNEIITVEPELYDALSLFEEEDSRYLYLAPVYELYRGLFSCENDWEAGGYDPAVNEDLADYVKDVLLFANDPASIRIELLGDGKVCLIVSDEYLAFTRENEIEHLVDFFYIKDAFITDMVASALSEEGFRAGFLTGSAGFTRSLGDRPCEMTVFDMRENQVIPAGTIDCPAGASCSALYGYPVSDTGMQSCYVTEDGGIRNAFIDASDGLCRAQEKELIAISEESGCAQITLRVWDHFLGQDEDYREFHEAGIQTICVSDGRITASE